MIILSLEWDKMFGVLVQAHIRWDNWFLIWTFEPNNTRIMRKWVKGPDSGNFVFLIISISHIMPRSLLFCFLNLITKCQWLDSKYSRNAPDIPETVSPTELCEKRSHHEEMAKQMCVTTAMRSKRATLVRDMRKTRMSNLNTIDVIVFYIRNTHIRNTQWYVLVAI